MKCEGCSGEVREGEELSRVFTVPAYLHTQEGREEVDTHRYIETPVEEEKKEMIDLLQLQSGAGERQTDCSLCISSKNMWTGVYFNVGQERAGHAFDGKQQPQQHTGLSRSTSVNLTLITAARGEIHTALTLLW